MKILKIECLPFIKCMFVSVALKTKQNLFFCLLVQLMSTDQNGQGLDLCITSADFLVALLHWDAL